MSGFRSKTRTPVCQLSDLMSPLPLQCWESNLAPYRRVVLVVRVSGPRIVQEVNCCACPWGVSRQVNWEDWLYLWAALPMDWGPRLNKKEMQPEHFFCIGIKGVWPLSAMIYLNLLAYLFLVVCLFVHVGTGACRDHERAMDVLVLEWQVVLTPGVGVGIETQSFARAMCALNLWAVCPALRQGFAFYPGWPWTCHSPASTSAIAC